MVTKQQLEEGLARFNQVGAISAQPLASESSELQTIWASEVRQNGSKSLVNVMTHGSLSFKPQNLVDFS